MWAREAWRRGVKAWGVKAWRRLRQTSHELRVAQSPPRLHAPRLHGTWTDSV